jgi:predicted AAA+ superfamily ATPase
VIGFAQERLVRPRTFFWRTQAGAEVDLLIATGGRLIPIEIKLGAVDAYAIRGLRRAMADLGARKGWIVTGAGERRAAGRDIDVIPWDDLVEGAANVGLGATRRVRR